MAFTLPGLGLVLNVLNLGLRQNDTKFHANSLLLFINSVAFCTDLAIHMDWTPVLQAGNGRLYHPLRYLQWTHTTPTLIYMIWLSSDPEEVGASQLLHAVAADVVMILTGLAATASSDGGSLQLFWGTVSFATFFVVLSAVHRIFQSNIANLKEPEGVKMLKAVLYLKFFLWTSFPVVWLLAELSLISVATETLCWGLCEYASQVVFVSQLWQSNVNSVQERRKGALHAAWEESNRILIIDRLQKKLQAAQEAVYMHEIADEVCALIRPLCAEGVALRNHVPSKLPPVQGERTRLMQVLFNLVGNASRFTKAGSITLSSRVLDNCVEISVDDTSPGLPQADIEAIFQTDSLLDSDLARSCGGAGMGLYLVKLALDGHSSDINVESEVGKGIAIHFSLPIASDKLVARFPKPPQPRRRSFQASRRPLHASSARSSEGFSLLATSSLDVSQELQEGEQVRATPVAERQRTEEMQTGAGGTLPSLEGTQHKAQALAAQQQQQQQQQQLEGQLQKALQRVQLQQLRMQGQHASTAVPPSHSSPFSLNPGASSPPNKPMQPHLRSSSAGSSAAQTPDVLAPRLCVQRVPSAVPKSAPLTTFITSLQSSLVQQQRDLYANLPPSSLLTELEGIRARCKNLEAENVTLQHSLVDANASKTSAAAERDLLASIIADAQSSFVGPQRQLGAEGDVDRPHRGYHSTGNILDSGESVGTASGGFVFQLSSPARKSQLQLEKEVALLIGEAAAMRHKMLKMGLVPPSPKAAQSFSQLHTMPFPPRPPLFNSRRHSTMCINSGTSPPSLSPRGSCPPATGEAAAPSPLNAGASTRAGAMNPAIPIPRPPALSSALFQQQQTQGTQQQHSPLQYTPPLVLPPQHHHPQQHIPGRHHVLLRQKRHSSSAPNLASMPEEGGKEQQEDQQHLEEPQRHSSPVQKSSILKQMFGG